MSILVTGATGQLGRLIVETLLRRGVAPDEIVAAGRSVEKIADLAERGVRVALIDYDAPDALAAAFAGIQKLVFVSGSELGQRVRQHGNVVAAAKTAGVKHVAYTSIAYADRTSLQLAAEHRATEVALEASGLPYTFLRNGWYLENYTTQLAVAREHGAIIGCAGQGRVSAASRLDFAEAAAEVVLGEGHAGTAYELGGDDAFTMADLAAEITRQSGTPVSYQDMPQAAYEQALVGAGLPAAAAAAYADGDRGIAAGELLVDSGDLGRLIGRPTTTLADAIATAIKG